MRLNGRKREITKRNDSFSLRIAEIIKDILENRARTYRQLGEEYDAAKDRRPAIEEEEMDEEEWHGENFDDDFVNYEPLAIEDDREDV